MRLFILFALFIFSVSGVAQTGNAVEDYGTAAVYYEQGDYKSAFRYFMSASKAGDANAQNAIGDMYKNGEGVIKSYTNAYQWYFKAANQGHYYAQNNLGDLYYFGNGVKQDYMKAFEWYSKASEKGYADAQFNIGYLYHNGYGVQQDYMKAFEWYSKAANQDFIQAMYELGTFYLEGCGVKQDYMKAFEWYSKAAEQGDADAMHNLGFLYYKGLGVNRDYNKSEQYFKDALENIDDRSGAYGFLAAIYALRDKDFKKATEYVNLSLSSTKEDNKERLAKLYGRCGYVYYLQGDMANAEKMWEKCIELNPNYPSTDAEFPKVMANYNINEIDTKIIQNPSNNTNTFAIVIGNEKYKNEVDVPFANNDSKIFSQYVEKTLGVPHNQIRLIENAGYNDIRIAVSWLVQAMQVCRGKGKAIIYYAGHGIPNESDLSSYLLPVDGIGNDPGSAYSLKDLYDKLGSIEVQSITIFLDACFSGSKREDGMLASARGVALKTKQSAPKGNMVVFSAAQGDETAYPYKDKQHGMFTYFLLKKLQETKGEVTLGELCDYLTEEVGRESFVKNGKMQTPTTTPSTKATNWRNWKLK